MPKPLNPKLYNLLQRNLPGGVQILCEGEAFVGSYHRDPVSGQPRLYIKQRGEEYFGNCPFCGDTRGRLYVNHRWAVTDKQGNDNLFLCYCYNENCTSSLDGQLRLKELVFRLGRRKLTMPVYPGKILKDSERYDPRPPGPIVYLDELPKHHPAVEYVEDVRGFNVRTLVKRYGVGYCAESQEDLARDRIYIPFVQENRLMGWQMRYIGDPPGKWPPKYFSCPGQPAKRMLYNIDEAQKYSTVLLVEGPIDVWGAGPQAVGLIGKKLSPTKLDLLRTKCGDAAIVVLLDPKQPQGEKDRGRPHQIEEAYERCKGRFKGGVVKVYLPEDHDPGSLERDYTFDCIRTAAKEQGVKVKLGKSAKKV